MISYTTEDAKKYQAVREAVIAACNITPPQEDGWEVVLGLTDVLRAIETMNDEHKYAEAVMRLLNIQCGGAGHFTGATSQGLWDLEHPLDKQPPAVIDFLFKVLCV